MGGWVGGGAMKLINGDKSSWECDGPEAKDINNASRHCSALPSPTLFLTSCFTVHSTIGSAEHGNRPRPEDVNYSFGVITRQLS